MQAYLEQFDWRAGRTWRAVCALAVLAGAFIAVAALASEVLVRDVLGMPLARDGRYGPDIASAAIMLLLALKMTWRRIAVLGLPKVRERLGAAGSGRAGRGFGTPAVAAVFAVWAVLTLMVYFLLFYTAMIVLSLDGPGRFTSLVAVLAPLMLGQLVIVSELERFGARPDPVPPSAD